MKKSLFLFAIIIPSLALYAQHNSQDRAHMMMNDNKNMFVMIMDTMMVYMDNAQKGLNVDAEFLFQMIPHHQAAITMAEYEIYKGKDFAMVQLAKSIVQEQTFEIQLMKIWLESLQNNIAFPQEYRTEINNSMLIMMKNMPANDMLTTIDNSFVLVMKPHHQAAVDMARVLLKYSENATIIAFAKNIISAEQIEIDQMTQFLNEKK